MSLNDVVPIGTKQKDKPVKNSGDGGGASGDGKPKDGHDGVDGLDGASFDFGDDGAVAMMKRNGRFYETLIYWNRKPTDPLSGHVETRLGHQGLELVHMTYGKMTYLLREIPPKP